MTSPSDDGVVMTTLAQARKMALTLPETTEEPHHELSSWRVKGKIFATIPDDDHIRGMLAEEEIRAAVAEHPDFCAEVYWGARLACVLVDLGPLRPTSWPTCSTTPGVARPLGGWP